VSGECRFRVMSLGGRSTDTRQVTEAQPRREFDHSAILAATIDELERVYEGEAARLMSACVLRVVDLQLTPPRSREGLTTVGVTVVAPDYLGQYLRATPEVQGRVRMALDKSLGLHAYVARFTVELDPTSVLAASA